MTYEDFDKRNNTKKKYILDEKEMSFLGLDKFDM